MPKSAKKNGLKNVAQKRIFDPIGATPRRAIVAEGRQIGLIRTESTAGWGTRRGHTRVRPPRRSCTPHAIAHVVSVSRNNERGSSLLAAMYIAEVDRSHLSDPIARVGAYVVAGRTAAMYEILPSFLAPPPPSRFPSARLDVLRSFWRVVKSENSTNSTFARK